MAPRGKKTAESADEWLIDPADRPSESSSRPEEFAPHEREPNEGKLGGESIGAETAQWIVPGSGANGLSAEELSPPKRKETRPPAPERADGEGDELVARLRRRVTELEDDLKQALKRADKEAARSADASAASRKRGTSKKDLQRAEKALEKQREENTHLAEQVRELEASVEDHRGLEVELRERIKELETDVLDANSALADAKSDLADAKSELTDAKKKARTAKPAAAGTRRATATRAATGTGARAKSRGRAKPTARSSRAKRTGSKNGKLDLNAASFEELRNLGLSVTQSARMIAYRDVRGGFESLSELDDIPGLSADTRRDLKARLKLGS